jgi:putative two-component system response regulator
MRETEGTILIVDDEPNVCQILVRWLAPAGYKCLTAHDGYAALEILHRSEISLVISDIMMPGMSGVELLQTIRKDYPDTAVLMVTAIDDRRTGILTLELGAYGYIVKPFDRNEILIGVANAMDRRDSQLLSRQYEGNLQKHIRKYEGELRDRHEIILRMISSVGHPYGETWGHVNRIGRYAAALAKALKPGRTVRETEEIRQAASMHDVGMVAVPQGTLLKPEMLSPEEFGIVARHTTIAGRLLEGADDSLMRTAKQIASSHHEKWDGSGYPEGLAGETIPEYARIVAVVDVFDALSNDRVYRTGFPETEVIAMMVAEKGKHFDPGILDTFLDALPILRRIREEPSMQEQATLGDLGR